MCKIILYRNDIDWKSGASKDYTKDLMSAHLVGVLQNNNRVRVLKSRYTKNDMELTMFQWNALVIKVMNKAVK
jgi:hypothetical protein